MKTLRRFMDDEEMDYAEAAEAVINKRKYLLNRVVKYEDISEKIRATMKMRNGVIQLQEKENTTKSSGMAMALSLPVT